MSERCSFTSEYMYNKHDYKKLRKIFSERNQNGKFLCIAPPVKWSNSIEEFEMPIIQGKTASMSVGEEHEALKDILQGVETEGTVRFVILTDDSDYDTMLLKDADGNVNVFDIMKKPL